MVQIKHRILLAAMSFTGFVIVYMLRVNLSVALVAMVNRNHSSGTNLSRDCPPDQSTNQTVVAKAGEFDWDEQTEGLILGSFFWGYILTQIPGGLLAERFGAKWVLGVGILWTAVLTLLTPLAARWSVTALIFLRVLEGIGEGVTFPAMNAMLSRWVPPLERTMMAVFVFSGSHMGTVIGLPLSGYLCSTDFLGGWPSVFYTFGTAGIVWFFFWCFLVYNSPSSHPWISQEEREYIEGSLKVKVGAEAKPRRLAEVPVKAILTSSAVWSLVAMHMSFNWLFYMLLTCLPTFLADVLNTPISEDGFVSAMPYLALWATANSAAILADLARRRSWISTTALRKLCVALGAAFGASGIAIVGNLGCDRVLAIAVLTVSVGFSGITVSGLSPNQLDLAPRFAGTLLGFSNSMATIPGMVAPVVVGSFTNHASTRSNWLKVFYLSAGINAAGCLCYLLFGSGSVQPWANDATDVAEDESQRLLNSNSDSDPDEVAVVRQSGHLQEGIE